MGGAGRLHCAVRGLGRVPSVGPGLVGLGQKSAHEAETHALVVVFANALLDRGRRACMRGGVRLLEAERTGLHT